MQVRLIIKLYFHGWLPHLAVHVLLQNNKLSVKSCKLARF